VRLFVALDFPDEVRNAIRDLIARLKPLARNARWVRPEAMHITLKFIGETDAAKVASIRAALAPIHSPQSVDMHFRGVGFFPDERRPRVAWCGVEASANLAELAAGVECALELLGISRESRAFVPHLTLARFQSPGRLDELIRAAKESATLEFGTAREMEFHLIESILKPSGAEYRRVATYAFVKENA
jgi:2'-5' RNA ligase